MNNNVFRWLCFMLIIAGFISLGSARSDASKSVNTFSKIKSIEISLNEIQRENKSFKIENLTKGSADWQWQILNAHNDSLITTSIEKNPTFKLPCGSYDVLLTAKGLNTLKRHFRRIITVLPPIFTEAQANEVIDFSKVTEKDFTKDYSGDTRPGYKILMKGTFSGKVKITGLRGTAENPVHIINSGQVVITAGMESSPYPFLWSTGNQYIIMDGKADPKIPYGFVIKNHPSKSGQAFFIGGEFNRAFEVCGLNIIGRQGHAHGASAIQLQATYSERCNASNWSFEYFHAHHNKIEEATNEGFYIGYFTDHKDSVLRPYRLGEVLIYRNNITNSGRDGLQIASADIFEVHDNYIDFSGKDGARNHNAAFSWNDGNIKGYCYRNTFKNASQAFAIFFGHTGKEAYVYSNLLIQGEFPKTARTDCYNYAVADNTTQPVGLYFFNNTMKSNNLAMRIKYKNVTGEKIPIVFAANVLTIGKTIPKFYPDLDIGKNHTDSTSWKVNNIWHLDSLNDKTLINEQFKPVNKNSAIFKKDFDVLKLVPSIKGGYYDHDGYPYDTQPNIHPFGCYSGYEFYIDEPIPN
jgi:hypothetical protein